MKGFVSTLAIAVCSATTLAADDKDKKIDPAKLAGKWELVKSTDAESPKGAIVDFTKDNKVEVELTIDGQRLQMSGTYKVAGDRLTAKVKLPDGTETEETDTIKLLTDDKLILIDKNKQETEFARKK
jgi:uncharacterized protein (TIGR03066 family)